MILPWITPWTLDLVLGLWIWITPWILDPGSWDLVSGTWSVTCDLDNTLDPGSGTWYLVFGFWIWIIPWTLDLVSGIWYLVSGLWIWIWITPGIWSLVSGIWSLDLVS